MNNLMSEFLGRHGIDDQLTASLIVSAARKWVSTSSDDLLREDVHVISYVDGVIKVAVRHAPAAYLLQRYVEQMKNDLLQQFPSKEIREITHKIDPKIFENQV